MAYIGLEKSILNEIFSLTKDLFTPLLKLIEQYNINNVY